MAHPAEFEITVLRWLKEGGRNHAIESTVHIVVIIHPGLLSIIIKVSTFGKV